LVGQRVIAGAGYIRSISARIRTLAGTNAPRGVVFQDWVAVDGVVAGARFASQGFLSLKRARPEAETDVGFGGAQVVLARPRRFGLGAAVFNQFVFKAH